MTMATAINRMAVIGARGGTNRGATRGDNTGQKNPRLANGWLVVFFVFVLLLLLLLLLIMLLLLTVVAGGVGCGG
jgi:hypothetical protein